MNTATNEVWKAGSTWVAPDGTNMKMFGTSIYYRDRFGEGWGLSFLTSCPDGTTIKDMHAIAVNRLHDHIRETYTSLSTIEEICIRTGTETVTSGE